MNSILYKLKITFLLLTLVISGSYAIAAECNSMLENDSDNTTLRDNEVKFNVSGSGIEHVFVMNDEKCSYSITSGQPWGGVYPNINNSSANIKAGRKNATANVAWVKDRMANNNVTWAAKNAITSHSGTALPNELNFAIQTSLELLLVDLNTKYECDNVIIAQGHNSSSRNNWWMFDNTENTLPAPYDSLQVRCKNETTGNMVKVNFSAIDVNEFRVEFSR